MPLRVYRGLFKRVGQHLRGKKWEARRDSQTQVCAFVVAKRTVIDQRADFRQGTLSVSDLNGVQSRLTLVLERFLQPFALSKKKK